MITLSNLMILAGLSGQASAQEAQMAPHNFPYTALEQLEGGALPQDEVEGKVVLYVNVASKCGFTPQYEGLQSLYETYKDRGFTIVGVPCNQFGGQEPGGSQEIASFCTMRYGVTFPLLVKQDVNGSDRSPLYQYLVNSAVGEGKPIKWNFGKFLVGRDGEVIERWGSMVKPLSSQVTSAVEAAL